MEIFKEGDKSVALCKDCKKKVSTTFAVRTTKIKDGEKFLKVPDVLVSVCDECDTTVGVPQQSFSAIAEVRKKAEKETLEVRLPRHLLDILNAAIQMLSIEVSSDLRGQLVRIYLAKMQESSLKKLRGNLKSDLLKGVFKRSSRLSIKVNSQLDLHVAELRKAAGFKTTELIDSVIVEVKHDILDGMNPSRREEMRLALLATG